MKNNIAQFPLFDGDLLKYEIVLEAEHLRLEVFFLGAAFEIGVDGVEPIQEVHLNRNVFGHIIALVVEVVPLGIWAQKLRFETRSGHIPLILDEIHELPKVCVYLPLV